MNMHSQYLRKYMALPSFRGGEGFCMLLIKFRFTFLGVENSVLAAFRMPHVKFSQYPTGTNCQKKQTCFLWLGEETKQNWLFRLVCMSNRCKLFFLITWLFKRNFKGAYSLLTSFQIWTIVLQEYTIALLMISAKIPKDHLMASVSENR